MEYYDLQKYGESFSGSPHAYGKSWRSLGTGNCDPQIVVDIWRKIIEAEKYCVPATYRVVETVFNKIYTHPNDLQKMINNKSYEKMLENARKRESLKNISPTTHAVSLTDREINTIIDSGVLAGDTLKKFQDALPKPKREPGWYWVKMNNGNISTMRFDGTDWYFNDKDKIIDHYMKTATIGNKVEDPKF